MSFKVVLAAVTAGLAFVATTPGPAEAAQPAQAITRCGQAIAASYAYLTKDLTCTQGFRISGRQAPEAPPVIVTIDLRGHRFSGQGVGRGVDFSSNRFFVGDVYTLKNGRISNWDNGAVAGGYPTITVSKVVFENNEIGFWCEAECTIRDTVFRRNGVGLLDTYNANVVRTAFAQNRIGVDAAYYDVVSGTNIEYASFDSNEIGVIARAILHSASVRKSLFTRNKVGLTSGSDVDSPTIAAMDNVFTKNYDGIYIKPDVEYDARNVQLRRNIALRNSRYGIYAPGATDLGGNRGAGNGQACVGVTCTRP